MDVPTPPRAALLRGRAFQSASLGALLLAVYASNGDFLSTSDALPNLYLPVSLLREGNVTFTPDEMSFMFRWSLRSGQDVKRVRYRDLDPAEIPSLRREGRLVPDEPHYYVVPSAREGEYVGIYGPGPGLAALPFVAAGAAAWDSPAGMSWVGKIAASAFVAASAVFLFLTALETCSARAAWAVALAYGAGTCAWSQSSQALWQQTPVMFFLALGAWALLRKPRARWTLALCGLAFGAAVLCRPTWGVLLLAAGLWLLKTDRKGVGPYAVGAAGPVLALVAYAAVTLDSFLDFGQMGAAAAVALQKTGDMEVWQTPIWTGAAGILLSPSRGLLVYSPFLGFAAWGAWVAWREPSHPALRPLSLALAGLLLLSFRWFDWWGGHSFGYRLVVDTVPLLLVLIIPVADRILSRPGPRWTFAALGAWSVGVQVLGAFAYDQDGWNARAAGYEVRVPGERKPLIAATREEAEALAAGRGGRIAGEHRLDVDRPEHRGRLWSLSDNPIAYYAARFTESRAVKRSRLRSLREAR